MRSENSEYILEVEDLSVEFHTPSGVVHAVSHSSFKLREGETLVFVEVKLRKDHHLAQAREFVTPAKQRKVRIAAQYYLLDHPTQLQPRFDVIEVYAPQGRDTAQPEICHWENAF